VTIPAIGVDAQIVPVGLNADGSMETPDFGLAGWYTEGPKPGDAGPSVIAAHVDSRSGPDVFYRLSDLAPGDEITVQRADGTTGTWIVEGSEQTDKDELPADRIWNATAEPVLRLITCGGDFDASVRHYTDNIIVYANPVPAA
jgi:sortase (surface protein transpeptidase)